MKKFNSLINQFINYIHVLKTPYSQEEKCLIKEFYDSITSHNLEQVNHAVKSSFIVKKDHQYFLRGNSPIIIALSNLSNLKAFEYFWDKVDESYKKECVDAKLINQIIQASSVIVSEKNPFGTIALTDRYSMNSDILKFAVENFIEPNIHLINKKELENSIKKLMNFYDKGGFRTSSKTAFNLTVLEALKRKIFNQNISSTQLVEKESLNNSLTNKELKQNEEILSKTIQTMNSLEKDECLVVNPLLGKFIELTAMINKQHNTLSVEHEVYIKNVLLEHLPEILKQYQSVPIELRKTYQDSDNKTAFDYFQENIQALTNQMNKIKTKQISQHLDNLKIKSEFLNNKTLSMKS